MDEVDEEFEKDFAALMSDFKLPSAASYHNAPSVNNPLSHTEESAGNNTVSFRVMMKRGGRDDKSKAVQASPSLYAVVYD